MEEQLTGVSFHAFMCSCLLLLMIPLLLFLLTFHGRRRAPNLPPTPSGLPIIGNLHQLGQLPHRSLRRLSAVHGPLIHLRLGRVPTVIVSSAAMAELFLRTHDLCFCTRPDGIAFRRLSYGGLDIAFAPYGEEWRKLRKICFKELLSSGRVESFRPVREEEVGILMRSISRVCKSGPVNLSEMLLCLSSNIICRLMFGRRSSRDGECGKSQFHELIMESTAALGGFNVGDFFPSMEWLNVLSGRQAQLERAFHGIDDLLEREIEARIRGQSCDESSETTRKEEGSDFTSILLQLHQDTTVELSLTRDHIKAVLMDMFIAGSDDSAAVLEWGMTELMRNPRVMKKAQDELRRVVGTKEVEESHIPQLQYFKLVVREILRLHPALALMVPHESREDCKIDGYDIPKKTRVYVNIWAIGRDPATWEDPEVFWPERFEASPIDYKGQHLMFIPFGAGRRICPGLSMGSRTVEITLANLLHNFNWCFPDEGKESSMDMAESSGIVVHKRSPLKLMAIPSTSMLQ